MTKESLIKQLEDTCYGLDPVDPLRLLVDDVIAALAQTEQEPVAIKRMKEWIEYLKRKSDFGQHMKIPSEMSAGTCWELAIELEQFINTTQPQRSESSGKPSAWVGLTDEEIDNINYTTAHMLAREVEAKLKEKNT